MGNRSVLVVSLVLACVSLGASYASAAPAADECIAKPNGVAPAGKHWYYRTNRDIQRKCWYLGEADASATSASPKKPVAAATPVERDAKISVQPPTANARAELIDEVRAEQPAAPSPQLQPEASQGVAAAEEQGVAAAEDTTTRNWAIASRWPDPSSFASDQASPMNVPAPAPRIENPSPVLAAEPAEPASVAVDSTSGMGFGQIAAGLILFVVIAGAIFMFLASRQSRRDVTENVERDYEMPWAGAATAVPATGIDAPERRRLGDEIEELDRLLTLARETRERQIGVAGARDLHWRPG